MNTTFMISGGAGKVICAIPALEKFARLNPDNDFRVVIPAWDSLYWGNPVLQSRTFNVDHKGLFDHVVKNNRLVVPEPYHMHSYYNQKKTLIEAFDESINSTNDHSDLTKPNLYISTKEDLQGASVINKLHEQHGKKKVIVFQPYGRGMSAIDGIPFDQSTRSIMPSMALTMSTELSKYAVVVYFGDKEFMHPTDKSMVHIEDGGTGLRMYLSLIKHCDYFIGCDSIGQHIARSFNKPGTVIMGATSESQVSYPDHFNIVRNGVPPVHNPYGIAGWEGGLIDILNQDTMTFTDEQIDNILYSIVAEMI